MRKVSLIQMKERRKGKVIEIYGSNTLKQKMMSLGIYPGREIVKLSHFALKGPVAIKVGRSVLALGHGMASKIMIEV